MEEDLAETRKMVEIMRIQSLKIYKCLKLNNKVDDGQVLFIFRIFDFEQIGEPGQLTDETVRHAPKCVQLSLGSSWFSNLDDHEFFETVSEVAYMANLFFFRETAKELAIYLTRLIRCCYRFSDNMLSVSSDSSLVFVVEVGRTYATKGFIEAKERIMLFNSTSRRERELIADNHEERVEHVIVDDHVDNNGDELEDDVCFDIMDKDDDLCDVDVDMDVDVDDADDCDYRSVVMDDVYDDNSREDEDEEVIDDQKKEEINCNIIDMVRSWRELPEDSETILEEIKPLITYQDLHYDKIGNDYVITKEAEKHGECAICLTPFAGKKIGHDTVFTWYHEATALKLVRLGCGHSFHYPCIFKWLEKKPTCPLCRSVSYVIV